MLWPLLFGAAFLGDVVNYLIGRWLGRHLLSKPRKYLKPEHVRGGARVLRASTAASPSSPAGSSPSCARWCPSSPAWRRWSSTATWLFAALAAVLWVTIFLGAGYLFGNIQWVQDYLAVALAIAVAASAIPGFIIWAVHYLRRRRAQAD